VLTIKNFGKTADSIFKLNVLTWCASKYLSYAKWLTKEALNLTRTVHCLLIILRQLFNTKDSDDVLQILIALEDKLYALRYTVVLFTNNRWIKRCRVRLKWVNRRVNTKRSKLT
jgi:hypothetical protein